ncbi:TIGR02449 family protein [Halopseudomonas salegens]|uniref:Cell division protein ZapB n=1 Tax=Halopseudomonas salegens TaxID=1434072 RepID=A0A1H2H2W8_9GAMM|nr:TIGR02449 family protein [Halopseudomonas salegens]SDU25918.1 cell division protein ZapB [Halopseudomonas salegens]
MAPTDQPDINTLSLRVSELIALCDRLQQQNQHLLAQERSWREERLQLIEKNDLARQKVEAMILRLKSLEHDS